ncbi:MAG TPA: hypothetical protein VIB79_25250 [Candidatus Binatia bacterium]
MWSIIRSSDGGNTVIGWGGPSWQPVAADYYGDGKAVLLSTAQPVRGPSCALQMLGILSWVGAGRLWIPIVGDYDGDGKADIAVYHPVGTWSIVRSFDGGNTVTGWGGAPEDVPLTK